MLDATAVLPVAPVEGAAPEEDQQPKGPQTVEEANAYWQKRMSGKDRADAEEKRVLREALAAAEARSAATAAASSNGQPATGPDPEVARLQRELEQERQNRVIDTRKAKYPQAAANMSDEALAVMDEAKLAGLNARLDDGDLGGTFIAPTSPKRPAVTPKKPDSEKTVAELQDELRAAAGPYQAWRQQRG